MILLDLFLVNFDYDYFVKNTVKQKFFKTIVYLITHGHFVVNFIVNVLKSNHRALMLNKLYFIARL